MQTTTQSQTDRILDHLCTGGTLTTKDAWKRFGCARLAARILDLKRMGYLIEAERIKVGKKSVARYKLH
jgi:hypothetical protein